MKKKLISICLMLVLIGSETGCIMAENKSADGIEVIYDGETIEFDVEPEIINDRTMVPMRAIFEAFGAKVKWDGDTSTVTAKKKSKTITMTIGSAEMTKNDTVYTFDTAPIIEDGRTLVPIRAISDLLGLEVDWNGDTKTVTITTPAEEENNDWENNTGTIDLTSMTVSGDGVSVSDNIIEISAGGDFTVSGTLADGMIYVNTEDKVKLRLSGASITNSAGPAIYFEDADKCYITLTKNTENYLSDGEAYSDENLKGCISTKSNLEIKGNGSLTIDAKYNQGIHASDSLEITNGTITINSAGDAVHVNDTFEMSGGEVNITAVGDGIQSEEIVDITGGTVNVTTTGEVTASASDDMFGFGRPDFGKEMENPGEMTDDDREQFREQMQEMIQKQQEAIQQEEEADESEEGSSKGIKADWLLDISGGDISVNSTDHAIHCASDINISGGDMELASSVKKGISSHGDVTIDDGDIKITNATEGIESKQILTINGGNIDIVCSDDGLNAGGGSLDFGGGGGFKGGFEGEEQGNMAPPEGMDDMQTPPGKPNDMAQDMTQDKAQDINQDMAQPDREGFNDRPMMGGPGMNGRNSTEISSEHHIQINGGAVYISANGDGIDSNGSVVIAGGTVIVEGPENNTGDSALDADGLIRIDGGEVIAIGAASGMMELPGSTSAQPVIVYYYSDVQPAGTKITVKDSDGNEITEYTSQRSFQTIIFSSDELQEGETYTIYSDDKMLEEITLSDRVTSAGTMNGGGRGGFGFGGSPGDPGERGGKGDRDMRNQEEAPAE